MSVVSYAVFDLNVQNVSVLLYTVCPGSGDPPEKIFKYIWIRKLGLYRFLQLRYFRFNIIRLQSKIILGHMN